MSTAVIVIVFIVALIFAVGFLLLILVLIPTITQLKSTLLDIERTSAEIRDLARELNKISGLVEEELQKADMILHSSRKAVEGLSETFRFINTNILKRSAGLMAFIPAIKLGWNLVKKLRKK